MEMSTRRWRACEDCHAIWGVTKQRGHPISGEPLRGGSSQSTSRPARNLTALQVDMPSTFNRSDYVDSLCEGDKVWWKYYNDTTLCKLIDRVLANNYDLRIALSRVEQARQLYGVNKSEMLPQLSGELYGQRETTDYHDAASTRSDEFGLKLTAAWEINLWGKQKQNRDLAHATWLATEEDRRGVQMTLVAEVATLYYRLKAMWSELAIVNRTLSAREDNHRPAIPFRRQSLR